MAKAPCAGRGSGTSPAAGSPIALELEPEAFAGVPCWSRGPAHWARVTVAVAYDADYKRSVRAQMCNGGIARDTLITIAAAMAGYADLATGRNCRPTNEQLQAATGFDERTIQRAHECLRLLRVATEVLRGRQRTRVERLASWRVGDRGRGWASVWCLHDNPQVNRLVHSLSPHPGGSLFSSKTSGLSVLTTASRRPTGTGKDGAQRRTGPDSGGSRLAARWRADPTSPPWAQRHSVHAWAAVLAAPAAAGWSSRDINTAISDWAGVHGWVPDDPHRPIGLLWAMVRWHGDPAIRPAAHDEAREAAELAAERQRVAVQLAERERAAAARAVGRTAIGGAGHTAARAVVQAATLRALARRTGEVAAETAARDAAIYAARGGRVSAAEHGAG